MGAETHRSAEHAPKKERSPLVCLTPFQVSRAVLFEGYDHDFRILTAFAALNGFADTTDKAVLEKFSQSLLERNEPVTMENGFRGLARLAQDSNDPAAAKILKRLSRQATCSFVTRQHLENPDAFDSLPLSTRVVFAEAAEHGIPYRQHFEENGALFYFRLKKPSDGYLRAIETTTQNMGVEAKIAVAQSENPPDAIKKAGHNFIHVSGISASPLDSAKTVELSAKLNDMIDALVEPKYAGYVLRKELVTQEMQAVFVSIGALLSTIAVIHLALNRGGGDNFTVNALVKAITPVLQDLVTYYSQIKPFLSGKTNREKWEKMKIFAGPAAVGVISQASGGIASQYAAEAAVPVLGQKGGEILGSVIYGGIPFLHSVYTALTTINDFRKDQHCSWKKAFREISQHNPAVNALIGSSFTTFLTSVFVLGVEGQFNNDTAVALIEGGEEHAFTALFTYLQLVFGTSRQFDNWAKREIELQRNEIFRPDISASPGSS